MKIFFSPDYTVDLGDHTFPTSKFAGVAERFSKGEVEIVEPSESAVKYLELAHTPEWVAKILSGRVTLKDETRMEMRWSRPLVRAHRKQAAGTRAACEEALSGGLGLHAGGGSHHAFAGHAEGFCVFNDLACALLDLHKMGKIARAAVVDLDVHQGNGTASILRGKEGLTTFSMHQDGIYPEVKPPSTRDVGLPSGTTDKKYLTLLDEELKRFLDEHNPELVLYQAGVDCWEGDILGGLKLSREGIAARDENVFSACFTRSVPVAVTLGGGYAEDVGETIGLHAKTLSVALDCHRRMWNG